MEDFTLIDIRFDNIISYHRFLPACNGRITFDKTVIVEIIPDVRQTLKSGILSSKYNDEGKSNRYEIGLT